MSYAVVGWAPPTNKSVGEAHPTIISYDDDKLSDFDDTLLEQP
jgi:hypothetical protein